MATTAEASAEEDDPEDSRMTTESFAEEAGETTRLSERLRRGRRQCVYDPRELTTTTVESAEEDGPEDSATTAETSEEDEE